MRPLPHDFPFLALDALEGTVVEGEACAVKAVSANEWAMRTGGGRYPAFLLLEGCAQVAGLAGGGPGQGEAGVLAGVERFRVRRRPQAGDVLQFTARLERRLGAMGRYECRVRCGGEDVAEGFLLIAFRGEARTAT